MKTAKRDKGLDMSPKFRICFILKGQPWVVLATKQPICPKFLLAIDYSPISIEPK